MKLTFIANACNIIEYKSTRILTDPWLIDGAFEGSWFHYPPLQSKAQDFTNVDAIYISHLHPDHYEPETLKIINKPIIILKKDKNFLKQALLRDGFTNLIEIPNEAQIQFKDISIRLFDAFIGNPFFDCEFGNPIDTAALFTCGEQSVFNFNDNTPDLKNAQRLYDQYGPFTVVQLNYNAAGAYPSCFMNLNEEQKTKAHQDICQRNLNHMLECAKRLRAKWTQPFAGAYVLGGKLHEKNKFLGTIDFSKATEFLWDNDIQAFYLKEKLSAIFDKDSDCISWAPIYSEQDKLDYIQQILSQKKYDYESDPWPELGELLLKLTPAVNRVIQKAKDLKLSLNINVTINMLMHMYGFQIGDNPTQSIICRIDPRLLLRILDKKAHWNNAEIGCHIDFYRKPDQYNYDFHMLMSFLHS